jgi:hypothetical protein
MNLVGSRGHLTAPVRAWRRVLLPHGWDLKGFGTASAQRGVKLAGPGRVVERFAKFLLTRSF